MSAVPGRGSVHELVDLACRAPSVHNTQPWRWVFADGTLSLFADRSRRLDVADPNGRQMIISCGAALGTLEAAATAFRWRTTIVPVSTPRPLEPLARVRFEAGAHPRSHEFDLLGAVTRRRSDRRPFGPVAPERALTADMRAAASTIGVSIDLLEPRARETLAVASRRSAVRRRYDWTYQAELRWWAGHSTISDGIPAGTLLAEHSSPRVDMGRDFPRSAPSTTGPPSRGGDGNALDEGSVVVISTADDSPDYWLRAGRALAAVLLRATADGLATCSLTHLTEEPESRSLVRSLTPTGDRPQILVRVGVRTFPQRPPQTPRRPVESLLDGA